MRDGDWVVLAESETIARTAVERAREGSLADDEDFREWVGAAGEPGFITLYAAPEAGHALLAAIDKDPFAYWLVPTFASGINPMNSLTSVGMAPVMFGSPDVDHVAVAESDAAPPHAVELSKEEERLLGQFEHFDELSKQERRRLIELQGEIVERQLGDARTHEMAVPESEDPVSAVPEVPEGEFDPDDFPTPEVPADLRRALEDFSGLGGVVRFDDEGLELEMVSDRIEGTFTTLFDGRAGDDLLNGLPNVTAIAFGGGFADGWGDSLLDQLVNQYLYMGPSKEEFIADLEDGTGLDVPSDLEILGGEAVSVSVSDDFDPSTFFENAAHSPAGIRISGDPDAIEAVLEKIRRALPTPDADLLISRRLGDDVLVGTDTDYLAALAKSGNLGDTTRFREVVADAGDATSVLFVDFDAGNWLVEAMETGSDRADAEPFEALGVTVWADGDTERTVARVTVAD